MSIKTNSHNELICPSCGGCYLHHERIEIFDRREDDNKELHVTVTNRELKTDLNLKGNPSMRRQGIVIEFSCEGCENVMRLSLAQHKGCTEVSFIKTNLLSENRFENDVDD